MAQPLSTQHATALCAGVDAVISHLQNTLEYDFSLQHPRLAYVAGVNAYLEKMLGAGLQGDINRIQFENAVRLCLPRSSQEEPYSMIIKRQFLLASLATDILLYNAHWAQQYQARNLANPTPTAPLGITLTRSSIPETRNALMTYRQRVYAEAVRDAAEGDERQQFVTGQEMLMQTDVCINKWIELVEAAGGSAWAGDNEDVDNFQQGGASDSVNSTNDGTASEDARIQESEWEERADGRYYCTICIGHGGIVQWSSLKRHMAEKHHLDI